MALFHCSHKSEILDINTHFDVIIPEACDAEDIPCLYLLHGLYDDFTMWQRLTSVERYARERKLAVVMPNAEHSFYTDMKYGFRYYTYISEEIVDYTRKIFRLSHDREKTFLCGNSMGGYGAFKFALSKPEKFGAAVSLSGALDIGAANTADKWDPDAVTIWGEDGFDKIAGSKNDLFVLANDLMASDSPRPRLLQICGTEDFLYESNQKFKSFIENKPIDFRYVESDGGHNWEFWDRWLPYAMDFLLGNN